MSPSGEGHEIWWVIQELWAHRKAWDGQQWMDGSPETG